MIHKHLISLNEAIKLVNKEKHTLIKTEMIRLKDSLGRVCSKNIISPMGLPSFTSAGLDGYIFFSKKKTLLEISNTIITPGKKYNQLNKNFAYKINTGSVIPNNFLNFISLENASIKKNHLDISKSKISNKDIKKKFEDLNKGKIILKKNQKINFLMISLLASVGIKFIRVYQSLKIGIVSNGDELIPSYKNKKNHQIFDSNKIQILNFLKTYNINAIDLGILRDDAEKVKQFYNKYHKKFDVIISSGGSSFSSGDLISSFLEKNSEIFFKYIRIQPGRPIIFSKFKSTYVFSLPGNPLAVLINLIFIIQPFLIGSNLKSLNNTSLIKSGFKDKKNINITKFYRIKVKNNIAHLHNSRGSAKLISVAESDGLLISKEGDSEVKIGKKFDFFKFQF